MIQDHSPVPIENFNGLYGIDSYDDSVPPDHLIDSLNTITYGGELRTRDGFAVSDSYGAITRLVYYRIQGQAAHAIILNSSNQIYDLTTGTKILDISGMTDFTWFFYNGRMFISPHNGVSGLSGEFTYIYSGSGIARKAAGAAPVGGFTAVVSATAGVIEAGFHLFAWVYETDSGFVTAPSAAEILEFDGDNAVDFTNIPVGPSGTSARRLIASRAIQEYNGNEEGYEMFFVPGGRINNNVDTSLSNVDFFDADLQLSADYTYDQLAEIPSVVFISPYGTRMVYGGPNSDKNLAYISKATEPESISSLAGFLSFDPHETEGIKDATEFRDNLYVTKGSGKTYTVRDNTYEPSTWAVVDADTAIGADVNCIATYWDKKGSRVEFFVVADKSGLYKFNGIYEEMPISRKIKNWWKRINQNYFNKIQVIFDQDNLLLYILVPLDSATSPNYIIVGDYENGFEADRIKWHLWSFTDFSPSSIAVDVDATTKKKVFKVASLSGNIYKQEINRRNDNLTAINTFAKFALIGDSGNEIRHFGAIGFRIKGSGTLALLMNGQDAVDSYTPASLTLSATPGKEYIRNTIFQSERCSVKMSMNAVGSYFILRKLVLYTNVIFNSRPA